MRRDTNSAPAFPEIEAQLGDNPARFLLPTDNAIDELSWQTRAQAFIRGMDDGETIRAWQQVEVTLGEGPNGGPRQTVIAWLNQRQAVLDGTADQETADQETADQTGTRSQQSAAAVADAETPPETDAAVAQTASDTTSADAGLAADGGAPPETTPLCPTCHGECIREEIAETIGYWCPACGAFREPATEAMP